MQWARLSDTETVHGGHHSAGLMAGRAGVVTAASSDWPRHEKLRDAQAANHTAGMAASRSNHAMGERHVSGQPANRASAASQAYQAMTKAMMAGAGDQPA